MSFGLNWKTGDAVVDGATIQWEHYKRFNRMSKEQISLLSLQDYEAHEAQRMEKNAWRITNQVAERIDGAPVLSEFIHGIESQRPEDSFFFNDNYLSQYMNKAKKRYSSWCSLLRQDFRIH